MKTKFIHFVGIDVSKGKIDVCLIVNFEKSELFFSEFEQNKKGFAAFKKWLKEHAGKDLSQVFVCVENTGLYDDAVLYYLANNEISVCLENAATAKAAKRDQRQKNDKLDAKGIALYALRYHDEMELWDKPREVVEKIKQLLSCRSRLIMHLTALKQAQNEADSVKWSGVKLIKNNEAGIRGLQKDIEKIEADIWKLIENDATLLKMFQLLLSIPAIGKITAWHFICYTNEFKRVKSGKQLSAYCGVVPFKEKSGTSINKPARLPKRANFILKKLLHLCALTAIKMKGEFAAVYQQKLEEGKHVLKAINVIKNKLALRIAAVIRNEEPYKENYVYKLTVNRAK